MSAKTHFFKPLLQRGLIVHSVAIIALLGLLSVLVVPMVQQPLGFLFLLYLLSAILVAIPISLLAYRTYALLHADYIIERDGVRLQWGMRLEDIPMNDIRWIQQARNYPHTIRYPFFRLPGALLGIIRQKSSPPIEFLASSKKNLVLIGLEKKIYAVSPQNLQNFMTLFAEQLEYGSLAEIIPQSIYPSLIITQIFKLPRMWSILLTNFGLNLALLFITGYASTRYQTVQIGYNVLGMQGDPVPASQLMIFPILSLLFFFAGLVLAIIVYRKQARGYLVYLLQFANILSSLLFIITLIRILQRS